MLKEKEKFIEKIKERNVLVWLDSSHQNFDFDIYGFDFKRETQ